MTSFSGQIWVVSHDPAFHRKTPGIENFGWVGSILGGQDGEFFNFTPGVPKWRVQV